MPERDQSWSLFVAGETTENVSPIETLISWAFQNGMGDIEDDRAKLASIALAAWLLSTSRPRGIRDRATKSLACLLVHRLELAAWLIERFADVDDLYVQERLLAATYGAVLQGAETEGLKALTATVYKAFFALGRPASNELLRDHARGVLQYASWRGMLAPEVDVAKFTPPHSSDWPIEFVSDEQIENYKHDWNGRGVFTDAIVSSAVRDGDFARYIIDHVVRHWADAPIGVAKLPTASEIGQSWIDRFLSRGTADQIDAFSDICRRGRPAFGWKGGLARDTR